MTTNKRVQIGQNRHLEAAKSKKNDEFYTRLEDIDAEMFKGNYRSLFENKVIYLNCDNTTSNF